MNEFMTLPEAARALGVSRRHVYNLAHQGRIPSVKVAGRIRVPRAAWDRWRADQEAAALANVREAA